VPPDFGAAATADANALVIADAMPTAAALCIKARLFNLHAWPDWADLFMVYSSSCRGALRLPKAAII